jgi:hypothetical protein
MVLKLGDFDAVDGADLNLKMASSVRSLKNTASATLPLLYLLSLLSLLPLL